MFSFLVHRLTVEEHLWFYARLKGMPAAEVGPEVDKYVIFCMHFHFPHTVSIVVIFSSSKLK